MQAPCKQQPLEGNCALQGASLEALPQESTGPKHPGDWACGTLESRPPVSPSPSHLGLVERPMELLSSPPSTDPTPAFPQGPPTPRAPSAPSMASAVSLEIPFVQRTESRSGLWPSPLLPGWLNPPRASVLFPIFHSFVHFSEFQGRKQNKQVWTQPRSRVLDNERLSASRPNARLERQSQCPILRLVTRQPGISALRLHRSRDRTAGEDSSPNPSFWESASDLAPQRRGVLRATPDNGRGLAAALPLWLARGSCPAAGRHATGHRDTLTLWAHAHPRTHAHLTQRRGRPPCLPGWASHHQNHPGALWGPSGRTKHQSVHMPAVRIEELACDQERLDTRVLACSPNQERGAPLRGSARSAVGHDTDGSSWSSRTAPT